MDVTPRELREIDFRTEWKGYHRDDVDDLLERAAASIETQNERVRQLAERADALQVEAAQAAPADRETEDMLRRTLVLAQRTADEAVAEAQAEARRITDEADAHARRVVSEAEANSRRVAEGERQRLEAEVLELGARREALLADVEQLERFANDYRARLRSAIERDLDTLATRPPVVDAPRPRLHEVDIPAGNGSDEPGSGAPDGSAPSARPPGAAAPSAGVAPPGVVPVPEPPPNMPASPPNMPPSPPSARASGSVGSASGSQALPPTPPFVPAAPADPAATSGAPANPAPGPPPRPSVAAPPFTPVPPPAGAEPDRTIELDKAPPFSSAPAANAPLEAEVLDDDAFFASLREAVRDDSPLGPRADEAEVNLDEEQDGRFGNVFKRRR